MTKPATTAARRGERRTPHFFGVPDGRLYGCSHEPAADARARAGVVLCHPVGHEYLNAHRSLTQLASRLAGAGLAVLRFDYSGTGDSAGDVDAMEVERWIADVGSAVVEARARFGVDRISLVGMRLGAALAMRAAAARGDVHALVLWDPVLSGRDYLDELRRAHEQALRYAYVDPDRAGDAPPVDQFLGFPMPERARAGIAALDLRTGIDTPAPRTLLIESEPSAAAESLHASLARGPAIADHQVVSSTRVWQKEPLQGIVPHQLLESIVTWLVDANS